MKEIKEWYEKAEKLGVYWQPALKYICALIDMVEQRDKEIEQVIDALGITKPNPTIEEIVLVIGCIKVNEKELQDRLDGWEMNYADFVRDYFESYPEEED